jgi:hypothetical protein
VILLPGAVWGPPGWPCLYQTANVCYFVAQEVLLKQVTQQGANLHFVALAAAQTQSATPNSMPDLAKSLLQDMEVSKAASCAITRWIEVVYAGRCWLGSCCVLSVYGHGGHHVARFSRLTLSS